MEPTTSSRNSLLRSILIYGGVIVLLLAAVVLGARWAKSRSDQYAQGSNKPQTVAQQPQQPKPASDNSGNNSASQPKPQPQSQPQPQPQQSTPPASASQPQISSTNTQKPAVTPNTGPGAVPSTGLEDAITPTIAFGTLAFMGVRYVRSKRNLARLS